MRKDIGLYRGKRKDNGEWVEGYYSCVTDNYTPENRCYITAFKKLDNGEIILTGQFEVIPETVGEYTGFPDKNSKKIFEGDYWVDTDDGENDIFVVEFRNGQFCFAIYGICGALMPYGYDETAGGFGECDCVPMTDYNIDTIEVIGNIHDDPELLQNT